MELQITFNADMSDEIIENVIEGIKENLCKNPDSGYSFSLHKQIIDYYKKEITLIVQYAAG